MILDNIVPWGRTITKVDIFPLITLEGKKSPYLDTIYRTIKK